MALITEQERSDNLKEEIVASLQVCKWTIGPWGRRRVIGCQNNGAATQSANFTFCLHPLCRGARWNIAMSFEALHDLSLLSPYRIKARRAAYRISFSSQIRNKRGLEELIGKWAALLPFQDASQHMNKIYNDQAAFLKIDHKQTTASTPESRCSMFVSTCLQHGSSRTRSHTCATSGPFTRALHQAHQAISVAIMAAQRKCFCIMQFS